MKINMVLPGLNHSGGVQVALEYLNFFVEQGADVMCYAPMKSLIKTGLNEDSLGKWFSSYFKIKFLPCFNNLTIRDADCTIATGWITSYWVNKLSASKGKKVYFIQDYETWFSGEKNRKVTQTYHLKFDLNVTVSTALHDTLVEKEQCDSVVICNGIAENNIKSEDSESQFKKGASIVIGMPYREAKGSSNVKNCRFGIQTVRRLMDDNPNIEFKLFGFKKPKVLDSNISFLENPSRDVLTRWYDTIDIFYVPSLYEGWGLPAMEAMARGCVVLASDTGCIKEFGINKKNCIKLNNMKDATEVEVAVKYLIQNRELLKSIGLEAIKTVRDYSFEKEATKFYTELVKLKKK